MQRVPIPLLPVLLCALLVGACSESGPAASPETAPRQADHPPQVLDGPGDPIPLTCTDDLRASFRLLGPETIELVVADEKYVLLQQISASGARYAGEEVEFWSKGDESMLQVGDQRYRCSADA